MIPSTPAFRLLTTAPPLRDRHQSDLASRRHSHTGILPRAPISPSVLLFDPTQSSRPSTPVNAHFPPSPATPPPPKRARRSTTVPESPSPVSPPARLLAPRSPSPKRTLPRSAEMSPFMPSLRHSIFDLRVNPLECKVEVRYDNDGSIEMIGGANTGTSYSLTGRVHLTIPALPSASCRRRVFSKIRIEGESNSEFFDEHSRWSGLRLWAHKIDLVSRGGPLVVPPHDPLRPKAANIHLVVPFEFRVPGWLPPSHLSSLTSTRHGVKVSVEVDYLDAQGPVAPLQSSSPFTEFMIRRHRVPIAMSGDIMQPQEKIFHIRQRPDFNSPIECRVSMPEWVDVNGDERSIKIGLTVRARSQSKKPKPSQMQDQSGAPGQPSNADDADSEPSSSSSGGQCDGTCDDVADVGQGDQVLTNIVELGMEMEEVERYRSTPDPSFLASYPIPIHQPRRDSAEHPLLSTRTMHAGPIRPEVANCEDAFDGIGRRRCLLAEDGSQRNFFFEGSGLALDSTRWRKINVVLPMPAFKQDGPRTGERPQGEMDSPFFKMKQYLVVRVVCQAAGAGPEQRAAITMTLPIRCGTAPCTLPRPIAPTSRLPAYIQLYHENGEQRDCETLPPYTKASTPPSYENIDVDVQSAEPAIVSPAHRIARSASSDSTSSSLLDRFRASASLPSSGEEHTPELDSRSLDMARMSSGVAHDPPATKAGSPLSSPPASPHVAE